MWWFTALRLRRRNGARIIHQDGRVTECIMMRDSIPPTFAMKHAMVVAVPPGTAVGSGDEISIDWLPPHTSVRLAIRMSDLRG